MADVHDKSTRRRNMQAVRGKDTQPEIFVRRLLHARGFRFRLHNKKLPGKPDITLPKYKALIFVHGCFWHGHDCRRAQLPATNTEFWRDKIRSNQQRDRRNIDCLTATGWHILVIWGCALQGKERLSEQQITERLEEWILSSTDNQQLSAKGLSRL